jgi:hypothetical protein
MAFRERRMRVMPYSTRNQTHTIWQRHLSGMAPRQICDELNVSYPLVVSAIWRGRKNGAIPKLPSSRSSYLQRKKNHIPKGHIGTILDGMSEEQQVWLAKSTHDYGCQTLAELLLELVRDAHAESVEQKRLAEKYGKNKNKEKEQ